MKKLFVFVLVMAGCQSQPRPPVPINQMANILKDMHIYQTYLAEQKISEKEKEEKRKQVYISILSKYQVSKEDFDYSLDYYADHIQQLDSIYRLVLEKSMDPSEN